jgi:cell wall-associated NlpC family hydrolase
MRKAWVAFLAGVLIVPAVLLVGVPAASAGCDATRSGGWSAPLAVAASLTSSFGWRDNPTGAGDDFHTGQDLAAPVGTPVSAVADGVVRTATDLGSRSYGRYVVVDHGDGLESLYGHLSVIEVVEGQVVRAGQRIGAVGSTGRATGPHLHLEIRDDGGPVDPTPWLATQGVDLAAGGAVAGRETVCGGAGTASSGDPVVAAAQRQIGVPYSWGGGSFDGPTAGICCSPGGHDGRTVVGFDCSGLVVFAWAVGSDGRVRLPHGAHAQHLLSVPVAVAEIRAGDLLFFDDDAHVGLADGLGGMVHAPRTGKPVETVPDVLSDPYWAARFDGAARPKDPLA